MSRLKKGDLIKFDTLKTFATSGLCIARAAPNNCLKISEKINLDSYPSYHDFTGSTLILNPSQIATVVSYLGRPCKIKKARDFEEYDVYEVFVSDIVCQMFSANLILIASIDEGEVDQWSEEA